VRLKNEPVIVTPVYEIHILVKEDSGDGKRWYRWTRLDDAEVTFYTDPDNEMALENRDDIAEFKVVEITKKVTRHYIR
jgi:hypothetical protein